MSEAAPHHVLARHYEACFAAHGPTPRGVDWPDAAGADLRYRVMLDLLLQDTASVDHPSLLDFGCGAGGLLDYMRRTGIASEVEYRGHDVSAVFVDHCRTTFPEVAFTVGDVLDGFEPDPVDYVIANGVFTERLTIPHGEMMDFMLSTLRKLFDVAGRGLAFNVMSTHVDWERDDLFHVAPDEMARRMSDLFGRRFVIRHDYPLFEYTTYVYT